MLKAVSEVTLHEHTCFIYRSEGERRGVVEAFLRAARRKAALCLYFAEGDLASARGKLPPFITNGIFSSRISILPVSSTYFTDKRIDTCKIAACYARALQRAKQLGCTGVATVVDNGITLAECDQLEECLNFERKVEKSLASHEVSALCLYDERKFTPAFLHEVRVIHPHEVVAYCPWLVDNVTICGGGPGAPGSEEDRGTLCRSLTFNRCRVYLSKRLANDT